MSRLEASCFPVTGSHSLLCRERTEVWPSWGCCAELHEAVRVACPARPARHGARLRLTSASPDPPCRSPGSETKSVSSPDPARGWFQLCPPGLADTLGCTLHLGSVSRTARASAATTRCHAPTWWQAHMKQRGAQGQMGLGLHCVCGRGGGLTPGLRSLPTPHPGPAREGAPCQPEWGLSLSTPDRLPAPGLPSHHQCLCVQVAGTTLPPLLLGTDWRDLGGTVKRGTPQKHLAGA